MSELDILDRQMSFLIKQLDEVENNMAVLSSRGMTVSYIMQATCEHELRDELEIISDRYLKLLLG